MSSSSVHAFSQGSSPQYHGRCLYCRIVEDAEPEVEHDHERVTFEEDFRTQFLKRLQVHKCCRDQRPNIPFRLYELRTPVNEGSVDIVICQRISRSDEVSNLRNKRTVGWI